MTSQIHAMMVGIDFSEGSTQALERALQLAEPLGAHLQLVHVYEETVVTVPEQLLMPLPDLEELRAKLQSLSERIVRGQVPVTLHLRAGKPAAGMLDAIAELSPDLVVVGSHGRGAVLRTLLGSTSTALAHRSPVPVLIEPAAARKQS